MEKLATSTFSSWAPPSSTVCLAIGFVFLLPGLLALAAGQHAAPVSGELYLAARVMAPSAPALW